MKGWVIIFRVQFVVTNDEYDDIKVRADNLGISISQYCKDMVIPRENSFESTWRMFIEKLENYPQKVEFDVSQIMTRAEWDLLNKTTRLAIARRFNKVVKAREKYPAFSDVEIVGRSSSNVSIYRKN